MHRPVNAVSTILDFQAGVFIRRDPALSYTNMEKMRLASLTWFYTLGAYLEVPPLDEPVVKAMCERILVIWERYGDALGLWLEGNGDPSAVPFTSARCGWKSCLCGQVDSGHRMKVCKGCFQAYYCTEHCHKIDWKEGHRDVCKARAERSSVSIHEM
ncbi:hypothetical protein BDW22DRAFT_1168865 [Trametopsis cervina]|nr:hypothetical protein BDW22DRAFT_1168865 [Trametopsis cervina]